MKEKNFERLLTLIFRPSEVPEETVEEANQEVRPGTIPHGYEVGSFVIKVFDKSLPLNFQIRQEEGEGGERYFVNMFTGLAW